MSFTLKNFLGGRSPDLAAAAAAVADAEAGAPDATAVAGVSDADAAAVAAPAAAAAGETDAAAASPPPSTAPADPGAVAEACALAGVANLARPLIDAKLPMTAVQDRIKAAGDIRAAVGLAAKACPTIDPALADQFIANGASAEHVKTKLFDMMSAAQSPEIHAGTPPVDGADPAALQAGWDRAREKVAGTSAAASGGWDTARRTVAGR